MKGENLKIFLTGGSGFIGNHFLTKLLGTVSESSIIYCLVRNSTISIVDKRIVILQGNLDNIDNFKQEILESDYIYHLGANAIYGSTIDYDLVNYEPTKKLVDILSESKSLKNFIFVSTIGVCDRAKTDRVYDALSLQSICSPKSKYGLSKLKAEEYIKKSTISFTIIRPTRVYGPGMRQNSHINVFVDLIYRKKFFAKLGFPGKVSLIHVNDLAVALVGCLNNEKIRHKTYFAVTENLSLGNLFKDIYFGLYQKHIKQLRLLRFHWFFSRIHHRIPLSIANLFLDYLCAKDDNFIKDFSITNHIRFEKGILDVIKSNTTINGSRIVTGANSGIGYELAKLLHKEGKKIILVDKNINNIDNLIGAIAIQFDLTHLDEIPALCNDLQEKYGNISVLINNAGVGFRGDFSDLSIKKIKITIEVNISAPIMITHYLLSHLIKNKSTIVNIGSSSSFYPLPGMSLYAASKSFINNRSNALWYELKNKCRVITFSPSGTNTNFQNNAGVKKNEKEALLEPKFVAEKILDSIKKNKPFVLLGLKTKLLLLILKFLPKKIEILLVGKLFEKSR